jgi:hypothetical protein
MDKKLDECIIYGKNKKERGVYMKRQKQANNEPTIAEGMNTEDELQKSATKEEIEKGEYTRVTTLSLDENDPS